ncbi:hypothetical protein [Roseateles sp.]|uniref:hypothetical protein n=1 Tax=Roseateles sp. TaxID=1971397 RepID=UPI003BA84795
MTKTSFSPLMLACAALIGVAGPAAAENFSKASYNSAKDELKAIYKTERDTCNKLSGNAKDICVEEAKGHEKVAMAQLEYNYTGKPGDEMKLREARYEARYEVAKEKCDDFAGDQKDICKREATTARDKAKADVKQAKRVNDAAEDAEEARMKADYKLAAVKCDTLAGDTKDTCMASAKARYNQRW